MSERQKSTRERLDIEIKKIDELIHNVDLEASQKIMSLMESLNLHQAELEMQNDELQVKNSDNQLLRTYYNALFSLSPLASLVIDSQLNILESNQVAKDLLALNRFSLIQNFKVTTLFDTDTNQKLYNEINKTLRSGKNEAFDIKVTLKDEVKYCKAYLKYLNITEQRCDSFLLILEDVTDSILLREKEQLFFEVLENADEMLFITDHNGMLINCTEHILHFFNIEKKEDLFKYLPSVITDSFKGYMERELIEKRRFHDILEVEGIDQKESLYLSFRCFPIIENGLVKSIGAILNDDTKRVQHEKQLSLAIRIFNEGSQAIMILDKDYTVTQINLAFEHITGYKKSEILGQKPFILDDTFFDTNSYDEVLKIAKQKGSWEGEIWSKRKNGEHYVKWVNVSSYPKMAQTPTNYIVVFRDISEQKLKEKEVTNLAYYDPLTHCGNRRKLAEDIKLLLAEEHSTNFSFLFFDLDHFKVTNDIFGHETGDLLLISLIKRVKKLIRSDDMIYRLGGDEFLIVLQNVDMENLWIKSSKLLDVCKKTFTIKNKEISSGVSIGIASYPKDGHDFSTLLKHADAALYKAKENGRHTVEFFDPTILNKIKRTEKIESFLRKVISNNDLSVVYMPIVNNLTNKACGVELLLRLESEELGKISPDEFIPIAERTGLIHSLTSFVFAKATNLLLELSQSGLPLLPVSINISSVDFKNANFIFKCINKVPVNLRNKIKLELTERILLENTIETQHILQGIKKFGVSLSIDDFGTQYSSLNYLLSFPIDEIKIDKSFIDRLEVSYKNKQLYKAMLALIKALECDCVAEGVETEQQSKWLAANGCHYIQGYFYSKPLTLTSFLRFIASHYPPV
jgi:diguanylate cyclase (GGDEF)-like protein/PAS domain S-box-containing protein